VDRGQQQQQEQEQEQRQEQRQERRRQRAARRRRPPRPRPRPRQGPARGCRGRRSSPRSTRPNPRRSRRNIGKPTPKYFDEDELVADEIESYCIKKDYEFSDEIVAEFNAWLPTASKYDTQRYNWKTNKYEARPKAEIAKYWVQYNSNSIAAQKKQKTLTNTIYKYCQRNGFDYNPIMPRKFDEWMADPANKKLITTTYTYKGCSCGKCAKPVATTVVRSPAYCVRKWFSTLKKFIVF
jgi:hypothetical protein